MDLLEGVSGRKRLSIVTSTAEMPLVVAIHGGSYTSAYFDVAGHSLLDRAAANNIPILAPDRAGYGNSPPLPPEAATIQGHAAALKQVLHAAWYRYGAGTKGMVLIGHSIGAAIAATIASDAGDLPLIGLGLSGVGLRTPPEHKPQWESLPDMPLVDIPPALKDQLMFGPPDSFDASMPAASHSANAPAPRAELVDIVGTWHMRVQDILGRIAIPVHYRQGEFDHLWIVDREEVDGFGRALSHSPRVDAAMVPGTGHCMDFHRVGPAFQLQQLGFALQCASQ
jgi:pimeloyl-ACP methyl ester carboxylesterase